MHMTKIQHKIANIRHVLLNASCWVCRAAITCYSWIYPSLCSRSDIACPIGILCVVEEGRQQQSMPDRLLTIPERPMDNIEAILHNLSQNHTPKQEPAQCSSTDMNEYADAIDWIIAQVPANAAGVSCETKMWHFGCTDTEWARVQEAFAEIGVTVEPDDLLIDVAKRVRAARS